MVKKGVFLMRRIVLGLSLAVACSSSANAATVLASGLYNSNTEISVNLGKTPNYGGPYVLGPQDFHRPGDYHLKFESSTPVNFNGFYVLADRSTFFCEDHSYCGGNDSFRTLSLLETTPSLYEDDIYIAASYISETEYTVEAVSYISLNFSSITAGSYKLSYTETVFSAAPEPATWIMMIVGFGAVGAVMRKRQRATVSYA